MTVIAYRNGIMASDSLLVDGYSRIGTAQKIDKVRGWIIGGAGDFDATEAFMAKFDPSVIRKNIYIPFYPGAPRDGEECKLLAVSPRGEMYEFSSAGVFGRVYGPYYALGAGADSAMAAMAMGATAEKAVQIAIKHNMACGGKVQVVKLGK